VAVVYYDAITVTVGDTDEEVDVRVLQGTKPNDAENYTWQAYSLDTADVLDGSAWATILGLENDWFEGL